MSPSAFLKGNCEHCGGRIEFPAEGVGTEVACPHCAQPTALLETLAAPAQPPGTLTAVELKAAFTGPIRRPRISVFYHLGLLLVSGVIVLLPVVYLALIGLAGYGVYWYALHGQAVFSSVRGGIYVVLVELVVYLGPLLAGVVVVLFLFKPLLARSLPRAQPLALDPVANPRLYELVARIAELTGAPMPSRIDLSADVNAMASFRRGWLSLFGRDLVLTLGLPLVAGLNTGQLASVVAHELGHFTQGVALRLSYLVDSIRQWFARVVYERDSWDAALAEWADSAEHWSLSLLVACVQSGVWLSRLVLKLLLALGSVMSCYLSRQMEYHADRHALAISGSEVFEAGQLRARELAALEALAYRGLRDFWQRRNLLPDDLPAFFHELERRLPGAFHEDSRNTVINETAGLFATHPTDAQRIRAARRAGAAGVFHLDRPATDLFAAFPLLAKMISHLHYRDTLGLPVNATMLRPAAGFFAESATPPAPEPIRAGRPARPVGEQPVPIEGRPAPAANSGGFQD